MPSWWRSSVGTRGWPVSVASSTEALVLSRYELGSRIGAGAAGSVFRAVDTRSGQSVVVKFFDGEDDGFPPWASEMRLVLRFQHPNIVACLDTGFDESHRLWVLVFELAAGGSLRRAMAAGRSFTARQCARLLLDVGSALAYAHAQDVVHRDIKPENIVARADSEDSPWLLTDFGAGRFLARGQVARSLAGSTEYMAPEVLTQTATAASDQFSLGVVGMELVHGKRPTLLERRDLAESMRDRAGLLGIIGRLAATEPERRFAGMVEVVTALQGELRDMKIGGDTLDLMRPYLREQRGLSEEALLRLVAEWNQQGSFLDFLVGKSLLPRATARTLEAVRKGYLDVPVESVLGLPAKKTAPVTAVEAPAVAVSSVLADAPVTAIETPAGQVSAIAITMAESPLLPAAPSAQSPLQAANLAVDEQQLSTLVPGGAVPRTAEATEEATPLSPLPPESTKPTILAKPAVGMQIGRYTLQEQLGEGATATVFRSFHQTMNIPVAIKIFAPLDSTDYEDASSRFRREAQTLASLEHVHIVRILDADIDRVPYIVMEYVGKATLESEIESLGKLPAQRVSQIGIAVADALSAAWKAGLLHRDVKPSNILERQDGLIKLVDFGIVARRLPEGGLNDPQAARGFISGTPLYIAPEQALSPDEIDFRADMYGLGATLYHAVVGRPPLVRATAHETMMAQVYDEPVPIAQIDPSFDIRLGAAIDRMLRKRPEDRFGSWAEVREALVYIPAADSALTPLRRDISSTSAGPPAVAAITESRQQSAQLAVVRPALPPEVMPGLPMLRERLRHLWAEHPQPLQLAGGAVLLLFLLLVALWLGTRA